MIAVWLRIKAMLRRGQLDRDLNDELQFHLAMREQNLAKSGVPAEEAHYAAQRALGNATQAKEMNRDMWTFPFLETLWQDVRYGLRQLRRNPGFTIVAVLALGLGIGANAVIFSAMNAALLRPLPYQDPNRLVQVYQTAGPEKDHGLFLIAPANYLDWKNQSNVFSEVGAAQEVGMSLSEVQRAEFAIGYRVTAGLFPLLGVKPLLGRMFVPADAEPGNGRVVILSFGLWRTGFASDPNILRKTVRLNGERYRVIGVMPPSFRFEPVWDPGKFWLPLVLNAKQWHDRDLRILHAVIARLKPGATLPEARSEMRLIGQRLRRFHPKSNKDAYVHVDRPNRAASLINFWRLFAFLWAAAGLVLLIACADVANLLIARGIARTKEITLRVALGAGRMRIVRQLITEGMVLSLAGGALGVLAAYCCDRVLDAYAPAWLPGVTQSKVDLRVLAVALALSLLTAVVASTLPAIRLSSADLQHGLKEGTSRSGGPAGGPLRGVLVAWQAGLAIVLLVVTGMAIAGVARARSKAMGFDPHNVLTFKLLLPKQQYKNPQQRAAFFGQVFENLRAIPGVEDVASSSSCDPPGGNGQFVFVVGAGRTAISRSPESMAEYCRVTLDYIRLFRIPLLRGNFPPSWNNPGAEHTALVNEAFARQYFPSHNPIGKEISTSAVSGPGAALGIGTPLAIVGVVGDTRLLSKPWPVIYTPEGLGPQGVMMVLRTQTSPQRFIPLVRHVVHQVDENQAVVDVRTEMQSFSEAWATTNLVTFLLVAFGGLALLLVTIGTYGVVSYSVAQRTREIGIRMALGASRLRTLRWVVARGLSWVLAGLALGSVVGFRVGRVAASHLLFIPDVRSVTLLGVISVAAVIALSATFACLIPARRATKVDPMVALRHE
jgi:predicted permease